MSSERATQILDVAEKEMRNGGFDAVSFRDIASAVGIKSASVHYHFPTKADLSEAVTLRYANRFLDGLGSPSEPSETATRRVERLADAYLQAYGQDASTCLCTVLGGVASHLPSGTTAQVRAFYTRLRAWIETALAGQDTSLSANIIVAILQGAMVLSIATGEGEPLREARDFVVDTM